MLVERPLPFNDEFLGDAGDREDGVCTLLVVEQIILYRRLGEYLFCLAQGAFERVQDVFVFHWLARLEEANCLHEDAGSLASLK